jgi:prohead serine protease
MTRTNSILRSVAKRQQRFAASLASDTFALPSPRGYAWKLANSDALRMADPTAALVSTDDVVMSATFAVSTSRQDRDGDIVLPKGFVLDQYRANPLWFFGHQAWLVPIGKAMGPDGRLAVSILPDRVIATCYFDQGDPDAVYIYGKVKRGFLNATSIGFMPLEAERLPQKKANGRGNGENIGEQWQGWLFKRIELLEISIVGVPSNAEALVLDDLDAAKISIKLKKALEPFRFAKRSKEALGLNGAVLSEGGALIEPADTAKGERGTDLQRIIVPKKNFPAEADAKKWLGAHQLATDAILETDDNWVAVQFPDTDCQPGTMREEKLADGVTAAVCQRQIETPAPAEGQAMAQKDVESCVSDKIPKLLDEGYPHDQAVAIAYSMCRDGKSESDAKAVTAQAAGTKKGTKQYGDDEELDEPMAVEEESEGEGEAEEQPAMPLGAQCLKELYEHIMAKLQVLEPGIAVRGLYEKLLPMIASAAKADYPDLDLGIDMNGPADGQESPAEGDEQDDDQEGESDEGDGDGNGAAEGGEGDDEEAQSETEGDDEDEDEEDDEERKKLAAVADTITKSGGRLAKRCKACIHDAAEYMEETGRHNDMPKAFRSGNRYHAGQLYAMLKEMERPEANGGEYGEEDGNGNGDESKQKSVATTGGIDWSPMLHALRGLRQDFCDATGRID